MSILLCLYLQIDEAAAADFMREKFPYVTVKSIESFKTLPWAAFIQKVVDREQLNSADEPGRAAIEYVWE